MVLAQLEVETIELVIPKSDEVVEEQTQIQIFLLEHLDVIEQKKGEPPKQNKSKLNYTVNFRMKNGSSDDPHEGIVLPEVDPILCPS